MKWIAIVTFLLLATSCSMPKLSQQGSIINVVDKIPKHCKEIKRIIGRGPNIKYAMNNIRNYAADLGGNSLYIQRGEKLVGVNTFVGGNTHSVYGIVYRCKK